MLPLHHPLVAVGLGAGPQGGQVRAGVGLAEELAPDLLAGQQRKQVALLLSVGAGVQQGGAGPADADGVVGPAHPGPAQLLVDHQLSRRIGTESLGRRPVGGDQPPLGQLPRRRRGVFSEPGPQLEAERVVLAGQCRVHVGQRRLARFGGPGR